MAGVTLTLPDAAVNVILTALSEAPYRVSAQIINIIVAQMQPAPGAVEPIVDSSNQNLTDSGTVAAAG